MELTETVKRISSALSKPLSEPIRSFTPFISRVRSLIHRTTTLNAAGAVIQVAVFLEVDILAVAIQVAGGDIQGEEMVGVMEAIIRAKVTLMVRRSWNAWHRRPVGASLK